MGLQPEWAIAEAAALKACQLATQADIESAKNQILHGTIRALGVWAVVIVGAFAASLHRVAP